jgi:hypothetical protein
LRGEV